MFFSYLFCGNQNVDNNNNGLKDADIVVQFIALLLANTLGNPHQVADLLLFELEVRAVDGVVELLVEGELVQVHFVFEERIFQRSNPAVRVWLEKRPILLTTVHHT